MRPLHTYYRNATPHSLFEGMKFSKFWSLLLSVTGKWLQSKGGKMSVKSYIQYFRLFTCAEMNSKVNLFFT